MQVAEHCIRTSLANKLGKQDINFTRESALALLVCSEWHSTEAGFDTEMQVM